MLTNAEDIIGFLKSSANPDNVAGMARYGINPNQTLGIPICTLRPLAKKIGKNHFLALELWESGIHEARILAAFIDDPQQVTSEQMDHWASDFDSWDVCDQVCTSLFDLTPFAYQKAYEWSSRKEEFVKRASFALMAGLAVHDKLAENEKFAGFLKIIEREAWDDRNYVRKAVNWALRNIGKRNIELNQMSLNIAMKIAQQGTRSARWIANDAIRELSSSKVINKLNK